MAEEKESNLESKTNDVSTSDQSEGTDSPLEQDLTNPDMELTAQDKPQSLLDVAADVVADETVIKMLTEVMLKLDAITLNTSRIANPVTVEDDLVTLDELPPSVMDSENRYDALMREAIAKRR